MKATMRSVDGKPSTESWRSDRVGAGMDRWRREFPDIDCSGKAVVGRLLRLNEVMLKEVNRVLGKRRLKYPAYAVMATERRLVAMLSREEQQAASRALGLMMAAHHPEDSGDGS